MSRASSDTVSKFKQSNNTSKLSVEQMFNLLLLSYRLQAAYRTGAKPPQVDWQPWLQLLTSAGGGVINVHEFLQRHALPRLAQLSQEGLLDSLLPHLATAVDTTTIGSNSNARKRKEEPGRIPGKATAGDGQQRNEGQEVVIHVCDEGRGMRQDFRCPQGLLLSHMKYFTIVSGGQPLEDVDISVHCDIHVFEWLMQWMLRPRSDPSRPQFSVTGVLPLLVSATFLQMDSLVQECMKFVHDHRMEVIWTSPGGLMRLGDDLLGQMTELFLPEEVEGLGSREGPALRIQGRLYSHLVRQLAQTNPQTHRGHYSSLSSLFQCTHCGRLLQAGSSGGVPCRPDHMQLDTHGWPLSWHQKDKHWDLSLHVLALRRQLGSWRATYWRLWGQAHSLTCANCRQTFGCSELGWCRYHPQGILVASGGTGEGVYTCCGERSFLFHSLDRVLPMGGCSFREHVPTLATEQDKGIWDILQRMAGLVCVAPPKEMPVCSWGSLEIAPLPLPAGLLMHSWEGDQSADKLEGTGTDHVMDTTMQYSTVLTVEGTERSESCRERSASLPTLTTTVSCEEDDDEDEAEGEDEEEEEQKHRKRAAKTGRAGMRTWKEAQMEMHGPVQPYHKSESGRWEVNQTTRINQDRQRQHEERAMKGVALMLSRRRLEQLVMRTTYHPSIPSCGVFPQLERARRLETVTNPVSTAGNNIPPNFSSS